MKELYTFDDVLIQDQFLQHEIGRGDVDPGCYISHFPEIQLPIISSNMDTVTGPNMSRAMLAVGAQACLHRFGSIEQNVEDFYAGEFGSILRPFVSIGLGSHELERAEALRDAGAFVFVIDVAHGGQMSVVNQAKALREILGDTGGSIVVGNFANPETIKTFLEHSGSGVVDAFKIGIGPGSACTTRIKTGVGYPQLSAIIDAVSLLKHVGIPVIADGGLKTSGDVAKALGAGAHMVMVGGMLAGTDETPGEKVYKARDGQMLSRELVFPVMNGRTDYNYPTDLPAFKKYRGSASKESYEAQGKTGKQRTAEGESYYVPCKGSVAKVLQDIEGGIRSAMTYTNSRTLEEFHVNCKFNKISGATIGENGAHGKKVQ